MQSMSEDPSLTPFSLSFYLGKRQALQGPRVTGPSSRVAHRSSQTCSSCLVCFLVCCGKMQSKSDLGKQRAYCLVQSIIKDAAGVCSIAVKKTMAKSKMRRKEFIWLAYVSSLTESRQELKKKSQRNVAYWLASSGLLSLLSDTTQVCLSGLAPNMVNWTVPHQP